MKKYFLIWSVLIGSCYDSLQAQKIRYKDLYPLLESGQYDLAIPLLRKYLTDVKGALNTNANVQLAIYMEQQALKMDVLKDAENVIHFTDTAITYYRKSRSLLTEKELKKNDEYYAQYERRDVRTGKVGVKLADIQYQWDKKIESLTERSTSIVELQGYLERAENAYNRAQEDFTKIKNGYPDEKALYLKADKTFEVTLDSIKKNTNKAIVNAGKLKTTLGKIEKAGYDPEVNLVKLESYLNDGTSKADFTSDKIDIWDYEKWIDEVQKKLTDVIYPLRSELLTYDKSLTELRDRSVKDSIVTADLVKGHEELASRLKQIDPDPLPIKIFEVRTGELNYLSEYIKNKDVKDSADLDHQVTVLDGRVQVLNTYDSLVNNLASFDWKGEAHYYEQYISKVFGGLDGLEAFIGQQKGYVHSQMTVQKEALELFIERSKWLIDEVDSIPLFEVETISSNISYMPMVIEKSFTAGLKLVSPDTIKGYFSLVTPAKRPKSKVYFQVRNEYLDEAYFLDVKGMVGENGAGQVYHLMFYSPMPEQETYLANLCKIYASDGLAWEKSITLDTAPKSIEISAEGNVVINYDLESYQGEKELSAGVTFDKKGELKQ